MGDLIECYNKGKLRISFDRKRNGYLLGVGKQNHFIDIRAYEHIREVKGLDLLDRLEIYDEFIFYSLKKEGILPSKLEEAFSVVTEIEQKKISKI